MMAISNFRGGGQIHGPFGQAAALENLVGAWNEFRKGKENKPDVQEFSLRLEDHLFALHHALLDGSYRHAPYRSFYLRDPKLRHIHKATVGDRLLHHAVMRVIEPLFEREFMFDSYASRKGKGLHEAVERLRHFAWRTSRNNTRTVYVLQCDIRKFFDSIDHQVLMALLARRIRDERLLLLLRNVIGSFATAPGKGLPLGNVTSQLFANVYLHELDHVIKRRWRIRHYIRYADDFLIVMDNVDGLRRLLPLVRNHLASRLFLQLHESKVHIRKWHQGIDFLGYVSFPHHAVMRTATKRRILRKMRSDADDATLHAQRMASYAGILGHCRGFGASQSLVVPPPQQGGASLRESGPDPVRRE